MHLQGQGLPCTFSASWLQNPRFADLPYRQLIKERRHRECRTDEQNVHTLYRRAFRLACGVSRAVLHLTADDTYRLFVNGELVGVGPAPSYLYNYRYNTYDITDLLRPGENCIAVQVYYQGLFNIALTSADNLQGLLCQLEADMEDGTPFTLRSNGSWRMLDCQAWSGPGTRAFGYETHVAEDVDLRAYPYGWTQTGFDDSAWIAPHIPGTPCPPYYTLVPQETPTPALQIKMPVLRRVTSDGRLFLDMGKELVGYTRIRLCGPAGHVLEVRHAEELTDEDHIRFGMRCGCNYQEYITLSGRAEGDDFTFYDYKGFRYIELNNLPGDPQDIQVDVLSRNHPFAPTAALTTGIANLRGIWDICEQGVKVGTQDSYLDCPTREKGGFLGDGLITALSHLILTNDAALYRKFIDDLCDSARFCPFICTTTPNYQRSSITDYSMVFPLLVHNYAMWTGDLSAVRRALPVIEAMIEALCLARNQDGLLENIAKLMPARGLFVMVDWPTNLRDGYDVDGAAEGLCSVTNQFFYGCLNQTADLYELIGDTRRAGELRAQAQSVGRATVAALYHAGRGLFVDHAASDHFSLHAQVLPLLFGLETPLGNAPLLAFIREKRIACGVYFTYHLLHGLMRAGAHDFAAELMLCEDTRSWVNMLKSGATTCMEAWGPDQKWNTSWCHPWSSSPVIVLWRMLGLLPGAPGYESLHIAPQVPRLLGNIALSYKTPAGTLSASVHGDTYEIVLPAARDALIELPAETQRRQRLEAGRHVFAIRRP